MSGCFIKKTIQTAVAVSALLVVGNVNATNGYFSHGYSTKSKGLAGTGVAGEDDSMAAATNPAGMARVGSRMDVGASNFHPNRQVTIKGDLTAPPPAGSFPLLPGEHKSGSSNFLVPHFGYNRVINDNMSVGVSVYGNGGMNTNYDSFPNPMCPPNTKGTGLFCMGRAGVNLSQLFIAPTFAMNMGDISFGVSPIIAYQAFEAKGLAAFGGFSSSPENLSNNGESTSTGGGIKIGAMMDVSPAVTLGLSYQSKVGMSEFDDYKGLFAESGSFDIPSSWTVGASFKVNDKHRIALDLQQINYSEVASLSNPVSNLRNADGSPRPEGAFGASDGAGFGWDDMSIVKLGWEISTENDVTWRIGYSHAEQPIDESEVTLNILAPAVIEDHLTFGFTKVSGKHEFNFAAMYAFSNSVKGANAFFPDQTVEIEMDQYELEVSYGLKFN